MATIDPSIALGVKPLQLENPLNAFAQMSQIQNYQRQNELANRAVEQEDALNRAYAASMNPQTGEIDANKLRQNVAGANLGSKLPAVEKSLMEGRKARGEVDKIEFENKKAKFERSVSDIISFDTRDQILGSLVSKVESGELDKPTAERLAASVPQDPRAIPSWQIKTARSILSAKDQLEQHFVSQDTGGGARVVAMPKYGGGSAQVVQGTQVAKTMTPGEIAADKRAKEAAAKPVWNEAGQSWITPPDAKNPTGTVTPVPEMKATKDQQSAIKALTSAGYNPVTGEDTISKLINKSTSGGLQTLSSAAIGHIFGASTEGRRAIAALEGTANQMATDIAGGKLGAGVSNTDREFIVSALGDVANPMKPAGDRLAGWEAAKARMMRTGMIPAPAGAGGTPAAAVPPTPKGVDNSIWNAMTPEERALWK